MRTKKNSACAPPVRDFARRSDLFPSVADLCVFLGIFLAANLAGALVARVAGFPWPDPSALAEATGEARAALERGAGGFNAVAYCSAMALTLGALLLYRRRRGGAAPVPCSVRGLGVLPLVWGAVMMVAAMILIEPLLLLLPEVPDTYGRGAGAALMLVVAAPLFEETIFRGVLLESARRRYGTAGAWVISSLLFAIVHIHPTVAVNAFFLGLVLGFVFLTTGSLWTSVALHALNNLAAYLLLLFGGDCRTLLGGVENPWLRWAVCAAAAAAMLLSARAMLLRQRHLRGAGPAGAAFPGEENRPGA